MSSYLNIYLEKKKEGEEKGERLLLCSISRAGTLYQLFYDNKPGTPNEQGVYEFTSDDLNPITEEIDVAISRCMLNIMHLKDNIRLVSDKDTIRDLLDDLATDREYLDDLKEQKVIISTLYVLFSDINQEWCSFNKLYWKVD